MLNRRVTRLLIEATEADGISRAQILDPLGLSEDDVVLPGAPLPWATVMRMLERVSEIVAHDALRLRRIGTRMATAPSYATYRAVAQSVVSAQMLYEVGMRWMIPSTFPALRVLSRFDGSRRVLVHAELPDSYPPCEAFFRIFEGSATQLPTMIGLPPAVLAESRVSGRSCDLVIEIPQARKTALLARLRRRAGAFLSLRHAFAALEEQRQELIDNAHALQRGRDELLALLDRLPDLVVVQQAGTILWANAAFVDVLGYELREVVGLGLVDVVAERSLPLVRERMGKEPDDPTMDRLTEVALRTRDGGEVVVEVAPTQSVVFDGVPARLVVGRDVTDRVRMQQTLIVADRLASIGLLAAGVAHEVNNPLGYVLNNIEIARKHLPPGSEVGRRSLDVALEGVDRIRVIVRDLLMLARGGGPVSAVDVREIAESTLALAARDVERKTRLTLDLRPAPLVLASGPRIGQVLLALVVNALESMHGQPREESSLVVRIGTAEDGRLLLEVADSGRGIAEADLPRIFEPFFTTKPAGRGTGLGLPIAQQLVVDLGGEITVDSRVGRGTTFRVLLPAAPAAAAEARDEAPATPVSADRSLQT